MIAPVVHVFSLFYGCNKIHLATFSYWHSSGYGFVDDGSSVWKKTVLHNSKNASVVVVVTISLVIQNRGKGYEQV